MKFKKHFATVLFSVAFIILSIVIPQNKAFANYLDNQNLTIIVGNSVYSYGYPQIVPFCGGLYLNDEYSIIDEIINKECYAPIDATVSFFPERINKFVFTKEKSGKAINIEKLKIDIYDCLSMGGGTIKAELIETKPSVTIQEIKKQTCLISSFTTYYSNNENRVNNIMLAVKYINGSVVESNQEFSFNKTVGVRSEERGFKTAKIIVGGQFADGVGGGVCQASTTLYNAALTSGLKITERHAHSIAVSYIANSFDAMVNSYNCDFKFLNNTNGKIFIEALATRYSVTFKIYGIMPNYEYLRESVTLETKFAKDKYIETDNYILGEAIQQSIPHNGYTSEGYLIKRLNGVIVEKTLISKDIYSVIDGLTYIGTRT